jgi:2-polyprenyl-6-methoxyphenol hydroxylase-like FAD-dependent oxidoreductase
MDIAIVGSGTAGAASALFLVRAGHRVTLFERVPAPGPVGAGIMMQPSGLLVLERLGCARPVLERGSHVDALVATTTSGRRVLDLRYGDLDESLFGVGLHRGVLFETLERAVLASDVALRLGVEIVALHAGRLVDADGRRHGPFDLVVVCDGARSRLRDALPGLTKTVRPYPWGALWYIGESRDERHELVQFVEGTRRMVGLLPTGPGLVSLFFSVAARDRDALLAAGLDAWKRETVRIAPIAEEVVERISSFDDLTFASYFDVAMPRWHLAAGGARVVLLGDAAHATSPQLGQGCNLALCDAAALADALADEPDVDRALAAYSAARRDHLAFYQLATRALTPLFQSDLEPLALLRDFATPVATRLPFVRREMIRAMAGTKTGWLRGSRETRMPRP